MGKDQELLDAARNGNVSVVEKILSQRARRSGPLASLRRGPGANVQDNSGYTPLHHAALNGHKDIVTLLLQHDASPNITDHKGSSPLHLAAWTGNTEIVKLLMQSNVQPNVNITNGDGESPLHCAAQYGHVDVVNLLLQHNCDPTIRNTKEETALDLAAQYGRLETVESLVKTHPELLTTGHTRHHSPLHLASRNGHKQVVQVLLNSGFPINTLTESGSALHEAATFGKVDVVRILLENGIDLEAEDCQHHTTMDILLDLKTHKSQEIAKIIQNHSTLITTAEFDIQNANPPPPQFATSPYENIVLPKWASMDGSPVAPVSTSASLGATVYQVPPRTPRSISVDLDRKSSGLDVFPAAPANETLESSFEGSDLSVTSSVYQNPPPPREIDAMSIGSSYYETPPTPREVGKGPQRSSLPEGDTTLLYQVPPPPREVHKRMSDPSSTSSSSTLSGVPLRNSGGTDPNGELLQRQLSSASGYVPMVPVQTSSKYLRPPQKPPRKSMSPHSPTKFQVQPGPIGVAYEYLCLATSGGGAHLEDEHNLTDTNDKEQGNPVTIRSTNPTEYVDMKVRHSYVPAYENDFPYFRCRKNNSSKNAGLSGDEEDEEPCRGERNGSAYVNVVLVPTGSAARKSPVNSRASLSPRSAARTNPTTDGDEFQKPPSLSLKINAQRITSRDGDINGAPAPPTGEGMPLSPTGYVQPPTPDFPPPSPGTAELGIHEKMRPLSKEYKRRSRDNETITEDEVFQLIQYEHGGITLQVVTKENKSVSTEHIEEIKDDTPFAGLQRGSKVRSSSSDDTCDESNYQTPCSLSSPSDWNDAPLSVSRPHNRSGVKRQTNVYENVAIEMDPASGKRHLSLQSSGGSSQYENADRYSILSPFDENAEWAKINDIMATFGGSVMRPNSLPRPLEEQEMTNSHLSGGLRRSFGKGNSYHLSPVGQWLSRLGLGEYENYFLVNGFDDLQFMGGNMIDEQDLIEMNICNGDHRKIILEAAKLLPVARTVRIDTPLASATVEDWLHSLHLETYIDTFHKNKFGDMERVRKMWEVELTTILEITRPGHKKRILASLGERPRFYGDINDLNLDLTHLKHEINQLDQMGKPKTEPSVNGTLKRRNGCHKAPAPPPPPRRSSSRSPCDPNGNKDGFPVDSTAHVNGVESIVIRDPSQLFTNVPASLTTHWKHKPEEFIASSCNYTAKYLGSTLIKELKGAESSKKSIQKLKKSTNEIAKFPNVILSISYKGVKFLDSSTKKEVCEHEIRNINCACQDADDLNHFAYITKDHLTGNHYCHVFAVATMEMATEIILTLGQAFEVAYQMALREKKVQSSNDHMKRQPLVGPHPPLVSPRAFDDNSVRPLVAAPASGERQ